jgi:hypothetical protein
VWLYLLLNSTDQAGGPTSIYLPKLQNNMRRIISIQQPTPFKLIPLAIFEGIAARFGCTECKQKPGDEFGIYCNRGCNPCKKKAIASAYEHHMARFTNSTVDHLAEHMLNHALHLPVPWAPELPFQRTS